MKNKNKILVALIGTGALASAVAYKAKKKADVAKLNAEESKTPDDKENESDVTLNCLKKHSSKSAVKGNIADFNDGFDSFPNDFDFHVSPAFKVHLFLHSLKIKLGDKLSRWGSALSPEYLSTTGIFESEADAFEQGDFDFNFSGEEAEHADEYVEEEVYTPKYKPTETSNEYFNDTEISDKIN